VSAASSSCRSISGQRTFFPLVGRKSILARLVPASRPILVRIDDLDRWRQSWLG
jgi:tRNA threonylcarbamoyladenosine biosynthesis protein TsaB